MCFCPLFSTVAVSDKFGSTPDFSAEKSGANFFGRIQVFMEFPVILEKHRQLHLWLIARLAEFPKDQRFLLADRIQRGMLDIQELLIRAVYAKEKVAFLEEINIQLDVVRLFMRSA